MRVHGVTTKNKFASSSSRRLHGGHLELQNISTSQGCRAPTVLPNNMHIIPTDSKNKLLTLAREVLSEGHTLPP